MKPINSRLVARYSIRQLEALHQANAAADAVDRIVAAAWRRLLEIVRTHPVAHWNARVQIHNALAPLAGTLHAELSKRFRRLAKWGHRAAIEPLLHELPSQLVRAQGSIALAVREDEEPDDDLPGQLELRLRQNPFGIPKPLETLLKLRQPAANASKETLKTLFAQLVFPPPSGMDLAAIVYAGNWQQRIAAISRLAAPDQIAATITTGFALGKLPQQVAADLLPMVDGVRASARRLARTEGMRVGHETQMAAWDGLGDMSVGFQIHATLDQWTRPAHAARNGTIYYKSPAAGQKGLDEMPHPPLEADGSVAHNCRCHLSPVLRPVAEIVKDPDKVALFTTAKHMLVPDPAVYSEWFARTDDKRRKLAVGVRRFAAVSDRLGRTPAWGDFLDPDTGGLLHVEALKREGENARIKRRLAVDSLLQNRKSEIERAATLQAQI